MAVQTPTAPSLPKPPAVPKVELRDGGTVHQVTGRPSSLSDEQRARDSVAEGGGALSKTTVSNDKKNVGDEVHAIIENNKNELQKEVKKDAISATGATEKRTDKKNTETDTDEDSVENAFFTKAEDEKSTQQSRQEVVAKDFTPKTDNHGSAYWLFSLLSFAVLAVVIVMTVFRRKERATNPPKSKKVSPPPETVKPRFETRV